MKHLTSLTCALGAMVLIGFFAGCETQSATSRIVITPGSAEVKKGQSVELVASGGYDYTWQLKHEEWGYLSRRTGASTVYTSVLGPADVTAATDSSAHVQIVTVVSTIPDSPQIIDDFAGGDHTPAASDPNNANLNQVAESGATYQQRGLAYITHLAEEPEEAAQ